MRFLKNSLLVFASAVIPLLLIEIALRFYPVNGGFDFEPVNAEQPVFHARPNRQVTTSKGWNFHNSRSVQINNAGFRNNQDYTTAHNNPLIAVIGDSYVEAIQVDYENTFYGRLSNDLDGLATVYSFGFSGAPLSQYLTWAKHAVDHYNAEYLTFNIISNDFDESMLKYGQRPGFYQYQECQSGLMCNKRNDYEIGNFRPIIARSALLRYLVFNVHILEMIANFNTEAEPVHYIGNVLESVDPVVNSDSKMVIDLFFRDLQDIGISAENISFLVDGRNYDTTDSRFDLSFFGQMRQYFFEVSAKNDYTTIDLKKHFDIHYSENGKHFESKADAHWNELGHEIAGHQLKNLYMKILHH